jgi:hypothetical protein
MHRNGEFNNAEIRAKVATGFSDLLNQKFADFCGERVELLVVKRPKILWPLNRGQDPRG